MADETPDTKAESVPNMAALLHPSAEQVRVRTDRFRSFYANNLALSFSLYDCSLMFGEITGIQHDGKPVVEEVFRVTMSREVTKSLLKSLKASIEAYEKQFGEIADITTMQMVSGPELTGLPKPMLPE